MTKRQNTILFIVLATLFNLVLTIILLIILMVVGALLLKDNITYVAPIFFLIAIGLGIFIYQKVTAFVVTKYSLEEKLEPILVKRFKKNNNH